MVSSFTSNLLDRLILGLEPVSKLNLLMEGIYHRIKAQPLVLEVK